MAWSRWNATGVGNKRANRWEDLLGRTMLEVNLRLPDPADFRCSLSQMSIDGSRFIRFRSTPHSVERATAGDSVSAHAGHFMVSTQLSGMTRMRSGGEAIDLRPGDVGVLDTAQSFTNEFSGATSRAVVLIDKRLVQPSAEGPLVGRVANNEPYFALIRQYVTTLADPGLDHNPQVAKSLLQSLSSLLSRTRTTRLSRDGAAQKTTKDDVDSFIRLNLANSNLSARKIASQFGLSLRTLFGLYETADQSLERSIIDMRLERAAELLIADEYKNESILNISILAGFKEVSHFSRRFRDAYGVSPSGWRSDQIKRLDDNSAPRDGFR
jgi:AraC-like DNA-binding protein